MKKIIRKLTLLLSCLMVFGIPGVIAQNSFNATGGIATGTGGTATFSLGQVFYETLTGPGSIINQGVIQNLCAVGVPKLSTTINSVTVNANNDGIDDLGAFAVCNSTNNILFNTFVDQNGLIDPDLRVYQTYTASNVTVPFCNNCSATMAAFTGVSGTAALINPALPGTLTMRFRSWIDANTNGMVDPLELASDWIQYTISVHGYPSLQSTLNTITLTNNRDGIDDTASLVVCNIDSNLNFSGIIDVNGVTPAAQVKVKQETIRTNVTFNGAVDGVYPIGSFPPNFFRTVALVNPAMSGTLVIRRTIFFDINNNNILDANECANDGVVYTIYVDGEAPVLTIPANVTVNCDSIPEVGGATAEDALDQDPIVEYLGETFTSGNCVGNYILTRTWTATDQCGNTTSASQTITVADTTGPTITVPADTTLQCTDPLPLKPLEINSSPTFFDGTYNVGTAVFGAPLTSTPLTADAVMVIDNGGNPYDACDSIINNLTGKIAVIERTGCTPPTSFFVTKANKAQLAGAVGVIFIFNQPGNQVVTMGLPPGPNPTITIPLMLVSNTYGNALKAQILSGPVNVSLSAPTVFASDNCSFTTITHQQAFTPGNCPSNYTLVNTWTATDQCGNATSASQTITVADTTGPTLTVPADTTLQCTDPLPLKPLEINSSPTFFDGTYNVGTAVFGAPLTSTPLTADAVMVIDNGGNPYDACDSIINNLTGKIAVIERTGCTPPTSFFVTKANKAQLAGAVGVIFIFNQPGNQVATMGLPPGPNPTITIPLMLVSNTYGNALKAQILSGPVNVSLSAPTVFASDNCSFTTITHQQAFTPGNCPSNYTLVNTWTATDQCGNATSASQTITVADTTGPTLTVPADTTLQCTDPLPLKPLEINSSPTFFDGTYNVGTAVFGAPLTSTPLTADAVMVIDNAGNPYDACDSIINNLTGKIAVIERTGCTPPTSFFVTKANKAQLAGAVGVIFIFNQPGNQVATMGLPPGPNPTITIPLMLVSNTYGNALKAQILSGPVNVSLSAPTVFASDNCSFTTITHQQAFTPGNCPSNYTLVNTWTATDQCGNTTSASQTITVADTTGPTLTVPADTTLQCTDPLPLKPLEINSSPTFFDGTYNVGTAVFGAPLTSTPLTADAVMVIDNAGNPYDACDSITNNLTGKIAVIERTGCTPPTSFFVTKANKAQLAGAVGVIFIFNQPGNQVATMGLPPGPNPTITIPLMLVSNTYGNALKAQILSGPVNVSLSAPTVFASDNCSFTTITHQQAFTPGNCPSNYTLVNTWTATDQCGNATTASQTITVADTTGPTLTVPADTTLQCTDPLPLKPLEINSSPTFFDGTYNVGTAVFGAPLTSTPLTADAVMVIDNAGNPYDACDSITNNLTGKIAVIERTGCTPPTSFFVTKANKAQLAGAVGVIFIFNQPGNQVATMGLPPGPNPTITIPLMLVSNTYGNALKAQILSGPVNVSLSAPTVFASDNCSFTTITHQQAFTPGNCPSNYTLVNTWTATDQCGNTTSASQTITVADTTGPTLTVPADTTLQCTDPLPLKPLEINSSPTFFDGTYNVGTAVFGAPLTSTPLTADAVMVIDNAGNPYDACDSIINNLAGKIAVIERTGCTPPTSFFVTKANKAQLAGAVGVIFIFNQPGNQVVTMGLPPGPNPTITIPLMLVSNTYGNALKAQILSGPVNVSLSAPTVFASDNCSFTTITHQQAFTPGNCPSNYTLVNTWTATDQCGNTTSASQTITVADTTGPTLTVPADTTLQCTDPLPLKPLEINSSPTFFDGTYNVGTAVFGAPLTSTPLTADAVMVIDNAGNPYDACDSIINNLAGKIAVIERTGCTPPTSFFVTKANKAQLAGAVGVIFIFNQPGNQVATMGLPPGPNPTITIPLMLVSNTYGNALKAQILSGPVNVSLSAPTVFASDNCSFTTITHQQAFTPGNCPSNYTLVNTWTATDQCGNTTSASQTITVADTTGPTLTVPADTTLQCTDPLPLKPLEINSSPTFFDGTYNVGTAVFGAPLTSTPLTADAVMVIDNAGNPYDACDSIINNLAGKIAVIERTGCTPPTSFFVTKANKAQLAGAVGVIFIFNQPGNQVVTMGLPPGPNPTITIPLMLVSNTYGNALKAQILSGPVNVSLSAPTVFASDNCSFTTITHQQAFTPGNCPSNYTLVNTWTATDQCGNATSASQTITVVDTTAPILTCPANITVNNTAGICGAVVNFAATVTDNCSTPTITYSKNPGTLFNVGTTTVTVTAADSCGNTINCSFTVTVNDNQNPVITCPASAIRYTNAGLCTYQVQNTEFNATATDNCAVNSRTYVLSGATTGSGTGSMQTLKDVLLNQGVTTVTWTVKDAANNTVSCSFTVTVKDDQNSTSYIIYATEDVDFGEKNYIGGDVGVTAANGKAKFKKNSVLDPYFVRAKNINVQLPSLVNNRVYSPATGGPTPPFMLYSGNTVGLSNITVTVNGTLNGNWKDVRVKKGITCTITGNNFGKITIEEGANVTFTAPVINLEKMIVEKGKKQNNILTVLNYSNPTTVKVKDKVEIGDDCYVNVGGPKVTFYVGDNVGGDEKFKVDGENSQVTANIMIPKGKLVVDGGNEITRPTVMTGWYIIEKLDSRDKYIYWYRYDCEAPANFNYVQQSTQPEITIPVIQPATQPADEFKVHVYPNPSAYEFNIQVISKSNEPVTIRILDMNGKLMSVLTPQTKANNIKVGSQLIGGTYFAEVIQGANRKTVKLVKMN